MSFSQDTPAESSGNRSFLITHTGGDGTGGICIAACSRDTIRYLPGFTSNSIRIVRQSIILNTSGGFNPSTPRPGGVEKPEGTSDLLQGGTFGTDWAGIFIPTAGNADSWGWELLGTPFLSGVKPR